jgi:hypothetical protein
MVRTNQHRTTMCPFICRIVQAGIAWGRIVQGWIILVPAYTRAIGLDSIGIVTYSAHYQSYTYLKGLSGEI